MFLFKTISTINCAFEFIIINLEFEICDGNIRRKNVTLFRLIWLIICII